jgi:hypothetical protein
MLVVLIRKVGKYLSWYDEMIILRYGSSGYIEWTLVRAVISIQKVKRSAKITVLPWISIVGKSILHKYTGRVKSTQLHPLVSGFIKMHPGDLAPS